MVTAQQYQTSYGSEGLANLSGFGKPIFLNSGTVFLTAVKSCKLRKAQCSPPLAGEDISMVFTSHSVPFPATRDLRSLVVGNGTS